MACPWKHLEPLTFLIGATLILSSFPACQLHVNHENSAPASGGGGGGGSSSGSSSDSSPSNHAPNVPSALSCSTAPLALSALNTCTLTAAAPADPDGDSVTYSDDGSTCLGASVSANGATITFTAPAKAATCVMKVKAYDGKAYSSAVNSGLITGQNNAPNPPASLSCPATVAAGGTNKSCTLTAASPVDVDGDSVTYTDGGSTCPSTVVNATTGGVTFTGPADGNTCAIKVKASDGTVQLSAAASANVTGVSAASLSFDSPDQSGSFAYGSTNDVTFTITNASTATAATAISFSGLSSPLARNGGTCGASLAASSSCTYIVRFTSPGAGTFNRTITLQYNDGSATQSITQSISQTGVAASATVAARYTAPNSDKWNYYAKGSDPSLACAGTEGGYWGVGCIHLGEKKKVELTSPLTTNCTGLTASDSLGAFDWTCDASSGTATFYSSLKANKGLRDLIQDAGNWRTNRITVSNGSYNIYQSANAKWWPDSQLAAAPDSSAGSQTIGAAGAGKIYVLTADSMGRGYVLDTDNVAFVTLPNVTYTWDAAAPANISSGGNPGAVYKASLAAGFQNFIWLEGDLNGSNSAPYGFFLYTSKFSTVRRSNATSFNTAASGDGIYIGNSASNLLNFISISGAYRGIEIESTSNYATVSNVSVTGCSAVGLTLHGNNHKIDNVTANSNPSTSAGFLIMGSGHTVSNITASLNLNNGIQSQATSSSFTNLTALSNGDTVIEDGMYLTGSNCTFNQLTAMGNFANGINVAGTGHQLTHIQANYNGDRGINISGSNNKITDATTNFNGKTGTYVSSTGNRLSRITTIGNRSAAGTEAGFYVASGYVTVSQLLSAANAGHGIYILSGKYSTIIGATLINNGRCGINSTSDSVQLHNLLVANNGEDGILLNSYNYNYVGNTISMNNNRYGIYGGANFKLSGIIASLGNLNKQCVVMGGTTNPGMVDTICTTSGTDGSTDFGGSSGAVLRKLDINGNPLSLATTFAGQVLGHDSTNASEDANGQAGFPSTDFNLFDWGNFENPFRGWGKSGSAFPNADNRGRCGPAPATCQIWDFRLKSTDPVLLGRSGDLKNPNQSFDFVNPLTACPAEVDGDVVLSDQFKVESAGIDGDEDGICEGAETCEPSPRIYLANAMEILGDGIGNDNGLCESDEACVYTPNFGAYQGEGDYTTRTCQFHDGTPGTGVARVTMYAYPINGAL